jgi:hypothetical protein
MNTLLLDPAGWDLLLDSSGNITMASNPYSIAQDVASAIKLFYGELYYNTNKGIPYLQKILGQSNPELIMKIQAEKAALTVPEVVQAKCTSLSITNRVLTGVVEIIDTTGASQNIQF